MSKSFVNLALRKALSSYSCYMNELIVLGIVRVAIVATVTVFILLLKNVEHCLLLNVYKCDHFYITFLHLVVYFDFMFFVFIVVLCHLA